MVLAFDPFKLMIGCPSILLYLVSSDGNIVVIKN